MFSVGFLVESILLSVALAMDCFTVSITCGLQKTIKLDRALLVAFLFSFFQGVMTLLGSVIGGVFKLTIISFSHWVAFVLLFIIGLKMIMDGRNFSIRTKTFDITRIKIILLLSVATSIDAFFIGVGFIMNHGIKEQLIICGIIFIVTFLLSLVGWKSGERLHFIKPRFALIVGGLVLIAIGIKNVLVFYL